MDLRYQIHGTIVNLTLTDLFGQKSIGMKWKTLEETFVDHQLIPLQYSFTPRTPLGAPLEPPIKDEEGKERREEEGKFSPP